MQEVGAARSQHALPHPRKPQCPLSPPGNGRVAPGHLVPGQVGGRDLQVRGLHAPDVAGVLRDGAVTGELARAGNVPDDLLGPLLGILQGSRGGSGPTSSPAGACLRDVTAHGEGSPVGQKRHQTTSEGPGA